MNPAVTGQRLLVICPERNRKHKSETNALNPKLFLLTFHKELLYNLFFATEFFRIFTLTADQNTVSSSKPRDRLLSVFFGLFCKTRKAEFM